MQATRRFRLALLWLPLWAVVACGTVAAQSDDADLWVALDDNGLKSMRYAGVELLKSGRFSVANVVLTRPDGRTYKPDHVPTIQSFDGPTQTLRQVYEWGVIQCTYRQEQARLSLSIQVTSTADHPITQLWLQPMVVRFPGEQIEGHPYWKHNWPQKPKVGRWPSYPDNEDEPTIIHADYGRGKVTLVNEQVGVPLRVGYMPLNDKAPGVYGLRLCTGRLFGWSAIDRPVLPGATDTYRISLRFAPSGTPDEQMDADVVKRFVEAYPPLLNWADRRPIGMVLLCSPEAGWPTNPRGYLKSPLVDMGTRTGRAQFRRYLLFLADRCVKSLTQKDAQGVIVWDIEGQEHRRGVRFLGDPRALPPEMDEVADEFFARFRDAGFRVGVTLRPTLPVRLPYQPKVQQINVKDPLRTLDEKISYAKERWGCTLFYIDSNFRHAYAPADNDPRTLPASVMRQLLVKHPDVLLIPEFARTAYYAYTAPYVPVHLRGLPSLPKRYYPDAFTALAYSWTWSQQAKTDSEKEQRLTSVKQRLGDGDIRLFEAWHADGQSAFEIIHRYQVRKAKQSRRGQ